MSENTLQDDLARLACLFASAVNLLTKNERKWYETKALFDALQFYKDGTLGWVEPKSSAEELGRMFCEALRGSRREYERLLDSLREFGVDDYTIKKLKSVETLSDLWRIPLPLFHDLVSMYPMEHVVGNALRQIQKGIGIVGTISPPAIDSRDLAAFKKFAEAHSGPPRE